MKYFRDPSKTLVILFLLLIALVPLVQTIQETFREGEGIVALQIFGQTPTAANLRAFEDSLESSSWAAKLSRPWLQFALFKCLKHGGEKVLVGSSGWYFYKPGLNYMIAGHHPALAQNATNDPVAAIVHFRDQLAAHGVHLLLMPVPNKDSVYPDQVSARAANSHGLVSPRTREILEKLRAHRVEVLDLFEEFRLARQQSEEPPLYLPHDTHWSPRGVDLAARAVARRLLELGWVQLGQSNYLERPLPVRRTGDLVQMLQSPMIERSIPQQEIVCAQVVNAASGEPYSNESAAEILVMGDSFLRIYQQDAPNSAGFIAHLAKELKQPMLSIVNDGGGATLVREELRARPAFLKNKKVLVWEFVERDFGLALKGWPRTVLPPPEQGP
jgi:hypothetical protein